MGIWRRSLLLWVALLLLVAGFLMLAAGRHSIGPVLLVVGYCILLPLFLWRSFRFRSGE